MIVVKRNNTFTGEASAEETNTNWNLIYLLGAADQVKLQKLLHELSQELESEDAQQTGLQLNIALKKINRFSLITILQIFRFLHQAELRGRKVNINWYDEEHEPEVQSLCKDLKELYHLNINAGSAA